MKRSGFCVMKQLIGFVRPLRWYMVLAIFLGVLGHITAAGITVLGGIGILSALGGWEELSFSLLAVLLLVCAVSRGLLRYGEQAMNHFIAFKLLALLRDRVFGVLRRLAPAKLEGKNRGDLIALITSDIELLEVFYAHTISPIFIAVTFSLLATAWIMTIHWTLGIFAFVAYMIVGLLLPLVTSWLCDRVGGEMRERNGRLSAFVLDSLRGLPEILQYGQGEKRLSKMNDMTDELYLHEEKLKRLTGLNQGITGAVILCLDLGMFLMASAVTTPEGTLLATLTMVSTFGPVVALSSLGATLQTTFAAGNRVLDLMEEKPQVKDITGKASISFEGARVEKVIFSYEKEKILEDVSISFPKTGMVGIMGRSGSGKSTLLKLLMRFWETQQGEITLSGRRISEINTEDLRTMEGYMTQETHLFSGTILENIRLSKPEATMEEVMEAAKKASIHDFILTLPNGYDTKVGELGETLSGGERQRLGLARAFLHDAPFLLLDEPTSNLDCLNEAVILRALHQERGKRGVVLVSHRPSTMAIVDTVYQADYGRMS